MMGSRRIARELALQFLYSCDMQGAIPSETEAGEAFDVFAGHFARDGQGRDSLQPEPDPEPSSPSMRTYFSALPYARELAVGVCAHLAGLDEKLAKHSHNWRVERMSGVDRAILRIAAFELDRGGDTPPQVVINEALEIAKRYSIADSTSFINGILDGMSGGRPRP